MRKIRLIVSSVLLSTAAAFAQFTTVTGTVVDPHAVPYALGTITPTLVSSGSPTLNGQPYSPPTQPVGLDKTGSFSFNVADNTQLQPAGTKWNFTVCSATGTVQPAIGTGSQCFTLAAPITISGASQSISTQLNAVAPALTIPLGSGSGAALPAGVAPGSALVSNGAGALVPPVYQTKPIYDTRDWMTCDVPPGSNTGTNASAGFGTLLSTIGTQEATIRVIGTTNPTNTCLVGSLRTPANVNLDFSGGGAFTLIVDHTAPGGGTFVQGAGAENPAASPTSTCSVTLNGTVGGAANHDILMMVALYGTFPPDNARITSVTDGTNFYLQKHQTTLNNAGYVVSYLASAIAGGNVTVTANFSHAEKNACIAWEISGIGPTPALDSSTFNYGTVTPFTSGSATLLAGDLVVNYGEDPNDAQTCTAGAGFTQPASTAGNVSGTNGPALCAEYILSGAGGSTSATQNFSSSPVLSSWVDAMIGLHPGTATLNILGSLSDADKHQIFYQATGTNGVIDFTGNLPMTEIDPEWWGASPGASAAVNTPAIQSSEYAAFGCGPTTCRINGSGLNLYNKQWNLNGQYSINAEIQFYHVIGNSGAGWTVDCKNNGGLNQTATNLRILDGQSDAYGHFDNCIWSGGAASTGALTDFDFDGTHGNDLRPQFLDFYGNTWSGNSQVAIGMLLAKSGGGAQGSNIYCYKCETSGFTTAGWQIGTATSLAQNALDIGYSGDMQGNPQYGMACYGCGYLSFSGSGNNLSTMENGFTTQTGFDVYCFAAQGPCIMEHMRSESRKLITCTYCFLKDVKIIDQANLPTPGFSSPVGSIFTGNKVTGDGAYYQVTIDAAGGIPFGGTGTVTAPIQASSGSATTIVNTNQTIAGAVTIKTFVSGETVTQAVTGSTGTLLNVPLSTTTVTGTASSGQLVFGETVTQAVTGVTATEQSPSPLTGTTQPLFITNLSGTADSTHDWVGGTSGAHYTPNAAPAFSPASPSMLITTATGAPDNTHNWTGGTSGAVYVPTSVPTSANYTVNGFTGMLVGILTGNDALCYGVVTSNTASVITVAAGWITKYPNIQCPSPDNTSSFVVEPNWNHGTVVSGGMTLVYMNENVIDGAFGLFEDVSASGGQWNPSGSPAQSTIIRRAIVSRPDWYRQQASTPEARSVLSLGSSTPLFDQVDGDWDVMVLPPGADRPQVWTNLMAGGATPFSSATHRNLGNHALCWNAMITGQSANEVCIGGRSDPAAGTTASRNIIEINAMLGRGAPVSSATNGYNLTNIAGTDTDFTGGPSTGNANGGAINFWTSNPGGSGTAVNSGLKRWLFSATGPLLAGLDNTYDIGASGASRPRNIFAGTSVQTPSGPVSGNWNCTSVTPVTVSANVATDQNLMACTIPAGTLNSVGKTLRIYAAGLYSTPAASTSAVTLKAKLCTVSGCGAGTVITPISITSAALGGITATNDPFNLAANSTTQTTGASSAYEAHGNLTIDISALASAAEAVYADNNTATVGTIDSTAQLFLQITIAFSNASASNSATERQLIVDSVN